MNQPNLPVTATRTQAVPESTDILLIIRRFLLLLIFGTIVGGAAGTGFYIYMRRFEPRYTASVLFRVLERAPEIGDRDRFQFISSNAEEVSQLIQRQKLLFEQDAFLEDVIASIPFHSEPNNPLAAGNSESEWLRDNKKNVMKAIKRDLRVVPKVNAASFEITMTAKSPHEARSLVNAAQAVYLNHFSTEDATVKSQRIDRLRKAQATAQGEFNTARESLAQWAKARDVDVQRSRYEIEKSALQQLTEEEISVNRMSVLADAYVKNIEGLLLPFLNEDKSKLDPEKVKAVTEPRLPDGTDSPTYRTPKQIKELLKLTPETEQMIENDPMIRGLEAQRTSWEQELAVETGKIPPSIVTTRAINDRLKKIAEQKDIERTRLRWEAAERMLTTATDDARSKRALLQDVEAKRGVKNSIVLKIGGDLMEYQQQSDAVLAKQKLWEKVAEDLNIATLNRNSDEQRIQPLAPAAVPNAMSSPRWYTYIPLGTLAGLGLSGLLAYALFMSDTRVRTPRDITRTLQLSLLGFVPDESDDRTLTGEVETAILTSPGSMVAEAFRQIRSHIMAQTAHNPANTLLIASITPGGGATTVAANIAAAMALNEMRVLLVDANFYRPGLARVFNEVPATGLANALASPDMLEASIVPHPSLPKLHLMGIGSEVGGASSEVFESRAFRDLLERLKSRYDMIIFDGAPLNVVSDSLALAARVDGVVSVVRADEVSRGTVSRVRDQLRNVHANLLGFVLNAVQTNNSGYFKENYRTFHRYAGSNRRPTQKLLGT